MSNPHTWFLKLRSHFPRNKQVFVSCRLSPESVLATLRQFIEFVAPGNVRTTAKQGLQRYGMDSAIHRVQP